MKEKKQVKPLYVKSSNVVYLYNNETFYIFHDLFGYIIGLSRDLIDLLQEFSTPKSIEDIQVKFSDKFQAEQLDEFFMIFKQFSCLLEQGQTEEDSVWNYFAYKGKWTLSYTDTDGLTTYYIGKRDGSTSEIILTSQEQFIINVCDGSRNLEQIAKELAKNEWPEKQINDKILQQAKEQVFNAVKKFASHNVQVIKLCKIPFSFFKYREEHLPSYLKSAAPFDIFNPGQDAEPASGIFANRIISPLEYYNKEISDPERQFDEIETTISHLFREPHHALNGETYGSRFAQTLYKRGILGKKLPQKRILEVGGGIGYFAKDFLKKDMEISSKQNFTSETSYMILDASSTLSEKQKEVINIEGVKLENFTGNIEEFDYMSSAFDLILCNEVISDLSVVRLTKEEVSTPELLKQIPEAYKLIMKYGLSFDNAPEEFYLNTGAIKFIENTWKLLKPGGTCILVEFGHENQFPIFSSHLDHAEFSIHFGHLMQVADSQGFSMEIEALTDFLELDLKFNCMATTRCYYIALKYLLNKYEIELKKIAYTTEMFEELVKDKINLNQLKDIRYENIEQRCMGLSPREFKVLTLYKPLPQFELDLDHEEN